MGERVTVGPWVRTACGCVWRESRPDGFRIDPTEPRACGTHRATDPASLTPSPQGMAVVPVTYHDTDTAALNAPVPTDRTAELDPARWAIIRGWANA